MASLRFWAIATLACIVTIGAVLPQHRQVSVVSAAEQPQMVGTFVLPKSNASTDAAGKFPRIARSGNDAIHVAANPSERALYWTKPATALSASDPLELGAVNGKTDYPTAAVAATQNGTVYYVWISQRSGVYIRRKQPGGQFESSVKLHSTGNFISGVDVAVTGNGAIFVAWNEASLYRYKTSTNGGSGWSGLGDVSSKTPLSRIRLAGGSGDSMMASFGSNNGHVYASIWNGGGFDTADLTPNKSSNDFFADATCTIKPNGKIYVAFRNAPKDPSKGGLFYIERQANGTWGGISNLVSGEINGPPGVAADTGNNLHIFWLSNTSGKWDMWYAFQPSEGEWQQAIKTPGTEYLANVSATATVSDKSYGHAVAERFSGSSTTTRYVLIASSGAGSISAQPVINSGNPTVNGSKVPVSFTDVSGNPTQIRWRWGAAPTDAANDSNGWQPFANTLSIAVPSNAAGTCQSLVLFTQVRNSGAVQTTATSDSVLYDTAVQANIQVTNPFLAGLPTTFSQTVQDTYNGTSDGAYNGDPDYTRMPQFFLGIYNNNDCSGLSGFAVPASNTSEAIINGTYQNKLTLAQGSIPNAGSKVTINVVTTDKLGNISIVPKEIIYDPANTAQSGTPNTAGLPVLNSNTAPSVNSANSIIRTLTFQNVDVDDTTYGKFENLPAGSQFWGVWIANSRTPVTNPNSSSLQWFPVEVPNPRPNFSVSWNLFNGIAPASRVAGTYYIYVKFLDGAGNATVGTLPAVQVNLTQGFSIPKIFLPEIRK